MSGEERRFYVVAYDIPDDGRRTRVARTLESYGDRLQYSVFVVIAGPARLIRLRAELAKRIVAAEDSIAVFDLGILDSKRIERTVTFIGVKRNLTPSDVIIL